MLPKFLKPSLVLVSIRFMFQTVELSDAETESAKLPNWSRSFTSFHAKPGRSKANQAPIVKLSRVRINKHMLPPTRTLVLSILPAVHRVNGLLAHYDFMVEVRKKTMGPLRFGPSRVILNEVVI